MQSKFIWVMVLLMAVLVTPVLAFSGLGTGSSSDPYQIINYSQLNEIRNSRSSYYVLMNDINCQGEPTWEPISDEKMGEINFQLDGNGYRISNFLVNGNYGSVYNTGAGFVGYSQNNIDKTMFLNITFYNASVVNSFSGDANAGILVGRLDGVYGYYNRDQILADRVFIYNSTVSTPVGYLIGFTGEFAGSFYGGYINCAGYNNKVQNSSPFKNGGIGGFCGGDNAFNLSTNVWSNSQGAGLFATSTNAGLITSSYWNSDSGYDGYGGTGKTTAEMKSNETYSGWDFTNTWKMSEATGQFAGYPIFKWMVDPLPIAPVANFTGTPTSGTVPLNVTFTDSSTNTPTEWIWTFGDGALVNATMQNPVHTYSSPGNYTVSLNATNAFGSNMTRVDNYINVSSPAQVRVGN